MMSQTFRSHESCREYWRQRTTGQGIHPIYTTNGNPMRITHVGNSDLRRRSENNPQLNDVLIVPTSSKFLISVRKLCENNDVVVCFDSQSDQIKDRQWNKLVLEGRTEEELYTLSGDEGIKNKIAFCIQKALEEEWHRRLGYLHMSWCRWFG